MNDKSTVQLFCTLLILIISCISNAEDSGQPVRVNSMGKQQVFDIIQDENGLLWVSAETGMYRSTGSRFVRVVTERGLNTRFKKHTKDSLLVVTQTSVFSISTRLRNVELEQLLELAGEEAPISAAEFHEGRLWITLSGAGLFYTDFQNSSLKKFDEDAGSPLHLKEATVVQLAHTEQGTLLLNVRGRGLFKLDPDSSRFIPLLPASPHDGWNELQLVRISDGSILIIVSGKGIYRLEGETLHQVDFKQSALEVSAACAARDGKFWIAFTDGTVRSYQLDSHDRALQTGQIAGIASDSGVKVTSLFQSESGSLWIGTNNGLYTWSPYGNAGINWHKFPGDENIPGNYCIDSTINSTGDIVFLTAFGSVYRLTESSISEIELPRLNDAVLSVCFDRHDQLLLGTSRSGVFRYSFETRDIISRSPPGHITDIAIDQAGTIYSSTYGDGVYTSAGSNTTMKKLPKQLPSERWQSIFIDSSRTIWLIAENGHLFTVPNAASTARRVEFEAGGSAGSVVVTMIREDETGSIWAATDSGLFHYKPEEEQFYQITSDPLITDTSIQNIICADNHLWLTTSKDLVLYGPDSDTATREQIASTERINFSARTGISSGSVLFIGGDSGYISLNAEDYQANPYIPHLLAASFTTARRSWGVGSDSVIPQEIVLDHDEGPIALQVYSNENPQMSAERIRYRLQDLDEEWNYTWERELTWQHLPPGRYRVQAAIQSDSGAWSEPAVLAVFHIRPPLWLSWQFISALAILLFSAGFVIHRMRTHAIEKRRKAVEQEVDQRRETEKKLLQNQSRLRKLTAEYALAEEKERRRISLALHDHVGHELSLTQIKIAEIIDDSDLPELTKQSLMNTKEALNRAIKATRDLTVDVSPPALYEFGLAAAAENLLERLGARYNLVTVFESPDKSPDIEIDMAITLYQVIRELAVNVIKHAEADVLKVSLFSVDENVLVRVRDNGKGFDVNAATRIDGAGKGLGLYSIRERISSLGGSMRIISKPIQGTDITITAPRYIQEGEKDE